GRHAGARLGGGPRPPVELNDADPSCRTWCPGGRSVVRSVTRRGFGFICLVGGDGGLDASSPWRGPVGAADGVASACSGLDVNASGKKMMTIQPAAAVRAVTTTKATPTRWGHRRAHPAP